MKKKGKLRMISWITSIIMVLSVFYIPLMGYAAETVGEETAPVQETTYSEEAVPNNSDAICAECGEPYGTCDCNMGEEEVLGPQYEITYYIEGEEQIYVESFKNGDTYDAVYLDYRCDAEMGIDVKINHLNGDESYADVEQYDESNWMATFYSEFEGEEREYTIDIYIDSPSSNNYCWMNIYAYDSDENSQYIDIDSEAACSEEGAVVTIPYGYNEKIEFFVYVESEFAQVDGLEAGWESGLIVQPGETKEFTITAQNGEERNYKVQFKYSDGSLADVDMYAGFYDSALDGLDYSDPYRQVALDFTEVNGVRTANVVLPYTYNDEEGINLQFEPVDNYLTTFENSIKLGEENSKTVEFDLTSPNGQVTRSYKITFSRQTEAQSKEVNFKTFEVEYADENGDKKTIKIDPKDAADADGAVVVVPEACLSEEVEEYYVDVYTELGGYGYFCNDKTSAQSYASACDYNYLDYSLELSQQSAVTLDFDVMTPFGEEVPYKVTVVNGTKAGIADIEEVCVQYTGILGEEIESWIWLGEEDTFALEPYDPSKPITIVGTGADGTPINVPVTFVYGEDETVIEFTSKSFDGENECTYSIRFTRPIHPIVNVYYQVNGEDYDVETYFNEKREDTVTIPYSVDIDDVKFKIMLLDGTFIDPVPEIVWKSKTRNDEHESLYGTLQFQAEGKTYTVKVISKGISSNTDVYMSLDAWDGKTYDQWDEPAYKYITVDSDKAATTTGATVTIPYKCSNDVYFYVYTDDECATIAKNSYEEKVKAGETRTYTVIAEDGTKKKYKIKFVASKGTSTSINMGAVIGYKGLDGNEGRCDYFMKFTKKNGVMVANMPLHYLYDSNLGISLYQDSKDYVTFNKDITKTIHPAANKKSSYEFVVISPNGKTKQKYRIDFAKESATQAAKAGIESMDLTYINSKGIEVVSDVDISKASSGKITVYVPKTANFNESMAVRVYTEGYSEVLQSPTEMGFGDPGMFGFGFMAEKGVPSEYKFKLISSDKKHVKDYTVTIKTSAGKHDCKWDKGTITTQPTYSKKGVKTYCCTVEYCDKTKTASVAVLKYKAKQTDVTAQLSTADGGYDNVKLSWDAVDTATGYKVQYKKSSSSKWTTKYVEGKTTYTTPGLSDGVKYSFRVYPYVTEGDKKYVSTDYDSTTAYTLKKVAKPTVTKSSGKAKVKWKNISGESGYEISMTTKSADVNVVATYVTTAGTYKTIEAEKGKTFYYKVRAFKYVTEDGQQVKVYGPWSTAKSYKLK